ncbi:MAG: hypothetical protein IKP64_05560 [Selenomonadaceae bacterium]|nr:hypothetical protein [Selenomonadaceae bacterium]
MTTLRQEAISIIESLPEEKISALMNFLRELTDFKDGAKRLAIKKAAFDELETLRREIPDLNYDKALAAYRNEKFGNANSD